MPKQFENGKKFDGENSVQDFDGNEMYLHPKSRSFSFEKNRKCSVFITFECSQSAVFKMYP